MTLELNPAQYGSQKAKEITLVKRSNNTCTSPEAKEARGI